jgi:PPK2 family polyphosphate:nucleotide phosphotransferase
MSKFNSKDFRYDGNGDFSIKKAKTKIKDLYEDKTDYEEQLSQYHDKMDELQSMMYAHNRYGVLVILQAMDAAGKDGTLKAVFSGINPQGLMVHSFKRPTETEIDHDFLWRCFQVLPERGNITIFNRSYYEEVLVVKVHPEIIMNYQRIPAELTKDLNKLWKNRYEDIRHFEKYLYNNGIRVIKFFLHVSKEEQAERLIERIEDPTKNWKFDDADVKERGFWNEYQQAFQDAISATATEDSPWYIIPADDKKNMRLMVANTLCEELAQFDMNYPESDTARQAELKKLIEVIKTQNEE